MNVGFAVLREPLHWEKAGDIDIVVPDIHEANIALKALGYLQFSVRASSCKYLRYDGTSGQWIHLDVQSKLLFGHIQSPRLFIQSLLERSRLGDDGIPRLDPSDETIIWIFHAALDKGYFDSRYKSRMLKREPASMLRLADQYAFLPKPLGEYLQWVETLRTSTSSAKKVVHRIRQSIGFHGHKTPPLSIRAYRRLRHLFRGPGPIVFLGPDGSGKSSIAERLAMLRWPPMRYQYMGPARESEMHAVFAVPMRTFAGIRKRYSKRHPIGLLARVAWQIVCYMDFWDRVLRHLYFQGSGGVVIFDRYACDMYFRKPTWWNEFLFMRMFARPRFVFLCVGDPDVIHERKPELLPDQIERTIELYRMKLARYGISYEEVNTTKNSQDEVLDQVTQRFVDNKWFRDIP